jgi:hypothetical protein
MTLTERFASFTPGQREQFANLKDEAALDAFTAEHSVELTAEDKASVLEYFQSGVLPLDDHDLEAVAVGQSKANAMAQSEAQARADGRIYMMITNISRPGDFCRCDHRHIWIREVKQHPTFLFSFYLIDMKCYKCGWVKGRKYFSTPSHYL